MALQLVGETATRERTGEATLKVSFHSDEWLGEIPIYYRGLKYETTEKAQQEDGTFILTVTYRGFYNEDGSASSEGQDDETSAVYEWSPSFEQTSITKHPDIEWLLEKYNGTVDEASDSVIWPKSLKSDDGTEEGSYKRNSMFGVTNFLSPGGVWSETRVKSNIPSDLFSKIGTVLEEDPPGGINAPSDRFWLTMPPEISQVGASWKVTRRWMLSGRVKDGDIEAAKDIYNWLI